MSISIKQLAAATLLLLATQPAHAAGGAGYNRVIIPALADVRLSVPFNQKPVGSFAVDAVTANGVSVTKALTAGTYANLYYVRFIAGKSAGLWSTISNNSANTFELSDQNVKAKVAKGDVFRVYNHHTLGTMFPNLLAGISFTNQTQLYIYENNIDAMVKNKSAAKTATYTTSGGGRWVGSGISNNTVLLPETQFIMRNNAAQQFAVYTIGMVPDYSVSMLLAANGDLVIGTGYPRPVVLNKSGLGGINQSQVFFYDNTTPGINKSAIKTASYTTSGGGRWVGAGVTGNETLDASQTVTFRLPAGVVKSTKIMLVKPF